jgi:hypothetical protein
MNGIGIIVPMYYTHNAEGLPFGITDVVIICLVACICMILLLLVELLR